MTSSSRINTNKISGALEYTQDTNAGIFYFCASSVPAFIVPKFVPCEEGIIFTPLNPSPTPTIPLPPTPSITPTMTQTPTIPVSPTPTPTITPTLTLIPSSNCLSQHISVYNTSLSYLAGTYSLSVLYDSTVNETYLAYLKDTDKYIHILPNQVDLETTIVVMYSSISINIFPYAEQATFLYTANNTGPGCIPLTGWGNSPTYIEVFDYMITPVGTLPGPKIINI
jgi:hypothetical protein